MNERGVAKKVVWWCPKCRSPVTAYSDCPNCKAERVSSWKCDMCGEIVVESSKCKCGRKRSTVIYNRMIVKKLFEDAGPRGHKNIDIIRRYAYSYASGHNLPLHLVEDALAEALFSMVKNFKQYDQRKGSFRTWAITIVKNALADAAKADATENRNLAFSLDTVGGGDDDGLMIETVLGYTFGAEDLIAAEEKVRFRMMATLARKVFGYVSTVLNGEYADISIYDLAVEAYQERDGTGWRSIVARKSGISRSLLGRRQEVARRTWEHWNKKEE